MRRAASAVRHHGCLDEAWRLSAANAHSDACGSGTVPAAVALLPVAPAWLALAVPTRLQALSAVLSQTQAQEPRKVKTCRQAFQVQAKAVKSTAQSAAEGSALRLPLPAALSALRSWPMEQLLAVSRVEWGLVRHPY